MDVSAMASKFLIDSHIHLFLEEHLTSLAWMTPDNPLNAQHSMHEYLSSVGRSSSSSSSTARQALGFVFVETDRKCHLASDDAGWAGPLAEFEFVNNVGTGRDARYRACAGKVLAIIPWAPVPSGRVAMGRYRECLEERSADTRLLKGFRYMLQSHPRGTMLCEPFVDSLRWMGEEGYVFELTVDCRGVGLWQLEESVEMLRRAHEGVPADKKLRVIVDHLAKPDLQIAPKDLPTSAVFGAWKTHLAAIAGFPNTYIKLSGAFSELSPALLLQSPSQDRAEWLAAILEHVRPWVFAAIDIFGPRRAMWGSDWPVCTVNGGKETAWALWMEVTERLLDERQLAGDERDAVWGGNAVGAYRIVVEEQKT